MGWKVFEANKNKWGGRFLKQIKKMGWEDFEKPSIPFFLFAYIS